MTTPQPSYRTIPLAHGYKAIVDEEDYERVASVEWSIKIKTRKGVIGAMYARHRRNGTCILMHRFILGLSNTRPPVDHVNRNGLDNRRCNLRICTNHLNQGNARLRVDNTSGFRGVSQDGDSWRARIRDSNGICQIGSFASAEEAARAYDAEAIEIFGEFANLNFPKEAK